ncbi:hypothetical protein ACQKH5_12520, partial [Hyphomonas sp. NPDC076900]|uniref:hypothetical protein n=1 Tax=unclassified Hyphomonas TaxID=2630699 RepID=UPI003D071AE0
LRSAGLDHPPPTRKKGEQSLQLNGPDQGAGSDQLMAEVKELKAADQAIRNELDNQVSKLKSAIESQHGSHSLAIDDIRETLTLHATGGIDLTLSGSVFFFVGAVLGTLPYSVIRWPYEVSWEVLSCLGC